MSKYNNLSDGKSDGIVLFYVKEGKIKPVVFSQDQADMLDIVLNMPFKESKLMVVNQNINIKNGELMQSTAE